MTDEVPVCLPCWRHDGKATAQGIVRSEDPPQRQRTWDDPGYPTVSCSVCGRTTNHGICLPPGHPLFSL